MSAPLVARFRARRGAGTAPALLLAFSILVGEAAAGHAAPAQRLAAIDPDRDPHGRPDRCDACHEPGPAAGSPLAPLPSLDACTACHPGMQDEMHAVGAVPVSTRIPDGWPTENGVVTCATCHAEPACDPRRPAEAPWLRGGPWDDPKDACWACHDEGAYDRTDPHHPERAGDPDDPSCSACHTAIPERGASAERAALRSAPATLCDLCHERPAHLGAETHLGRKIPATAEGTGLVPVTRLPESIALLAGGGIACWTCHEVHGQEEGASVRPSRDRRVADAIRALVEESDWDGLPTGPATAADDDASPHAPLLVLPAADGSLCRACHGNGPRGGSLRTEPEP